MIKNKHLTTPNSTMQVHHHLTTLSSITQALSTILSSMKDMPNKTTNLKRKTQKSQPHLYRMLCHYKHLLQRILLMMDLKRIS